MFDKEAIKALQYGGGIREASNALVEAYTSTEVISLPDHFTIHDLEMFMPNRRRARGSMETSSISDFAAYLAQHHDVGAMGLDHFAGQSPHAVALRQGLHQAGPRLAQADLQRVVDHHVGRRDGVGFLDGG